MAVFRSCVGEKALGFNCFLLAVLVCGQKGGDEFLSRVLLFWQVLQEYTTFKNCSKLAVIHTIVILIFCCGRE